MSQIRVTNLTFGYEGSFDTIFENVSFVIDADWKLGFIGRNGRGKTTFLKLLLGEYEYRGKIQATTVFDYFPYIITEEQMQRCAAEFLQELQPECEEWRVICELEKLRLEADVLYRPFGLLSHGERTKIMLALLFAKEGNFLLIDEPTNHLDRESRETVREYLREKKGFILVSHDRDLLNACIDHVLVLNRNSITVEQGSFASWWENKERRDSFEQSENEKHQREIKKLKDAAKRAASWAEKNEGTKIGFDPVKEHDRFISTRSYIGAKTKKMQSRVKGFEQRMQREIDEKEGLLKDVERVADLKLMPLSHHKEVYLRAKDYGVFFGRSLQKDAADNDTAVEQISCPEGRDGSIEALKTFDLELRRGERILLQGENGCGKSTFIKAVLEKAGAVGGGIPAGNSSSRERINTTDNDCAKETEDIGKTDDRMKSADKNWRWETGSLEVASGLIISYINQDTSFLRGNLSDFAKERKLEESRLKAILRQLDLERGQFSKNMEEYSEGQKKKVLIAASLLAQAHLYIWDEPLNYIDVFSRMQIENVILKYQPTMLLVEHDAAFGQRVATRIVKLP